MMIRTSLLAALFMLVFAQGMRAADVPAIKVMSYNIRFATAPDGENQWDKRKEFLTETIKAFDPDLLGTQETLAVQRDFLAEKLPAYEVLGVGRDDGKEKGEMMAIYWKKERFETLDSGHFWLSETPDKVGSKSWDSSLPRMVTWVKLRDLKAKDAKPILWMNTHYDHRGPKARLESSKLIRSKLDTLGKDCSLIVTGDFNAGEGSEPYRALFEKQGEAESPVVDTFRVAHPKRGGEEGTFSGFKVSETKGARIDWIACSRDWTVRSAGIDRTSKDGRTPSDHFAVTATLGR
jgi:endonuclease/exonuclease/phosphatase family metal-dependent hydrolase